MYLYKSKSKNKKYTIVMEDENGKPMKHRFGAKGMRDYTLINEQSVYTCRRISGRTLNNRQQFIQHFKTKAHSNWLKNLGKDENLKLIKELRVDNGKKDNKIRLQARHMKRLHRHTEMLENEISVNKKANDNIIKYKNDIIHELQENIKMIEDTTGHTIVYDDESHNDEEVDWELSTICSDEVTE